MLISILVRFGIQITLENVNEKSSKHIPNHICAVIRRFEFLRTSEMEDPEQD
jgi:hypothetical protein